MEFTIHVIPDPVNFSLTILTTIVLFLGLRHLLFRPVKAFLEKRQAYIEDNLRESEQKRLEAEQLEKEYSAKMQVAHAEAKDIVAEARKSHTSIVDAAKSEAEQEKTRILASANAEAERVKRKAMDDLRDDIVDVAMAAARELSVSNVPRAKAEQFTDERIQELSGTKWEN